jgi:hypothetical protein
MTSRHDKAGENPYLSPALKQRPANSLRYVCRSVLVWVAAITGVALVLIALDGLSLSFVRCPEHLKPSAKGWFVLLTLMAIGVTLTTRRVRFADVLLK